MDKKGIKRFLLNKQAQEIAILMALFIFSLAVRRIGAKHGFPLLTHPDEDAILFPVFEMTRDRTLNAGFFKRPNQILYLLNFLYLNALSYLKFRRSLAFTFHDHIVTFHYYGRLLIAILGSLIPVLAYQIGKKFKHNFALSAGLVFAFFPLYANQSLYITPDIPITLFTLFVMLFTLCYLKQGAEKWLYLAVFFSAVNTAEKYPGLISLTIVLLGVVLKFTQTSTFSWRRNGWGLVKKLLLMILLFVAALFVVAPYLFIEFDMVREAFTREARSTHLGADNLGWVGNLLFYVQTFGIWSNILSIFWIGLGVNVLIRWRDQHALILLYGSLYWIILSRLALHWERWSLPMFITPLFLIAIGITHFWQWATTKPKIKLFLILILLFLAQQFIATIQTAVAMTFTDTRVTASIFCEDHGIVPEHTIYEGYSPLLPQEPKNIGPKDFRANQDVEFIILSSFMFDRYFAEPERYAEQITFYESIRSDHRLIAKFKPTPEAENTLERLDDMLFYVKKRVNLEPEPRYKGPTIEIYQISR